MKSLVILISGRGTNMQAILQAKLPIKIAVISNKSDAAGLILAQKLGVPTAVVDHNLYKTREAFDAALSEKIESYAPDVIALAGFMRLLTLNFVNHYAGRMINIHPSLLPAFPGLNTHRQALEAGVKIHGCSVHFVTPEMDKGPIIIQAAVPVFLNDTEETLAQRVLEQEHRIYPQALRWMIEEKLVIEKGVVRVKGLNEENVAPMIFPTLPL